MPAATLTRPDTHTEHTSIIPPETPRLAARALDPLPLGAILPRGWLRDQLRVQADGLTGHLDEFWPSVAGSRWIGGASEGWERAPYWLDGLVPLAVELGDDRLLAKAQRWIDYILEHQHEDGWLGPREDPHEGTGEVTLDPWPLFVLFKVFTQWQEATGDARIIPALLRGAARIADLLEEKPLHSWGRMRWADLVLSLHWLFERTGQPWLLDLAAMARAQGYDWHAHFDDFHYTEKTNPAWLQAQTEEDCLPLHGVNNGMGVKSSAVWARQSGRMEDAASSLHGVAVLEHYHGQVTGMFSGDEHLAGTSPVQGTETCTVAEYLFSLEQMLAQTGEAALGDRLEQIAYNALPAALSKDMWARQYDQQPNQVLITRAARDWVSNGPESNLFSLEGNFGCCTANFHQGWPKFVSHAWMRTEDGLAATLYGPCSVQADIGGAAVTVDEETRYPFSGDILLTISTNRPAEFSLSLRVPAWAEGDAVIEVNGVRQSAPRPGTFHALRRTWQDGDRVRLTLPLPVRREARAGGAVSLRRGPLVLALAIGEEFEQVGGTPPRADWAICPATPWNYALTESGLNAIGEIHEASITPLPWSRQSPPVSVTVPARRVVWGLEHNSAAPPPFPPVPEEKQDETITLIPYGSANLRVAEFPVMPSVLV